MDCMQTRTALYDKVAKFMDICQQAIIMTAKHILKYLINSL